MSPRPTGLGPCDLLTAEELARFLRVGEPRAVAWAACTSLMHLGSEDADHVDAVEVDDPLGGAVAGGVGDQGDQGLTPPAVLCYMSNMSNSPATAIRFRPEERKAIAEAIRAHNRRTGDSMRMADAIRAGVAAFCSAEGVEWPQPKKERAP